MTAVPTPTQTRQVMMLHDDHVDAIRRQIERTHEPVEIRGENGRVAIFKIRHGKLFGYERTATGFVKNEVMKESSLRQMMARPDVERPDPVALEKQEIRKNLVADSPEMPQEKVEEHVGLIYEARRTVLALIAKGVPPDVAPKLVTNALKLNETDRGRLHNLAASYEESRRADDSSGNSVVYVSPPMEPIPARAPVVDPMGGFSS
jgi:hypothetical protein